jgi:hypothetical protein
MKQNLRTRLRSISPVVAGMAAVMLGLVLVLTILVFTRSFGLPSAIVTAALPITLGLVAQFTNSDIQNKREIAAKLREQKSQVYEDFIKFWIDMLMLPENQRKRQTGQIDRDELVRNMARLSQPLMLWPSNDVVRAWADFRRMMNRAEREKQPVPPLETIFAFEDLIYLMREDMGHSSFGVRRGDLLSFFVKDLETVDGSIGMPWLLGQKPTEATPD